jgi:hypothetical protein
MKNLKKIVAIVVKDFILWKVRNIIGEIKEILLQTVASIKTISKSNDPMLLTFWRVQPICLLRI